MQVSVFSPTTRYVRVESSPGKALTWDGKMLLSVQDHRATDARQAFFLEHVTSTRPPTTWCGPPIPCSGPDLDTWDGADIEMQLASGEDCDDDATVLVTLRPATLIPTTPQDPIFVGLGDETDGTWSLLVARSRLTMWRWNETLQTLRPSAWTRGLNGLRIVVARYQEDLSWLLPYRRWARIYDKSNNNQSVEHLRRHFPDVRTLPNVGREGHTYLIELLQAPTEPMESLPRRWIFLQGDPHPHNPTIRLALEFPHLLDEVQSLSIWYADQSPVSASIIHYFGRHSPTGFRSFEFPMTHQFDSPLFVENPRFLTFLRSGIDAHYGVNARHDHLAQVNRQWRVPLPADTPYLPASFCGMFTLTRRALLNIPRDLLQRLYTGLLKFDAQGGSAGYVLEKLWLVVCRHGQRVPAHG